MAAQLLGMVILLSRKGRRIEQATGEAVWTLPCFAAWLAGTTEGRQRRGGLQCDGAPSFRNLIGPEKDPFGRKKPGAAKRRALSEERED
jgi:hypothetical protein